MAKTRIKRLDIDDELKEKLTRASLKAVEDVVTSPPLQIMSTLRLSASQCDDLLDIMYTTCLPSNTTAWKLASEEKEQCLQFGLKKLDDLLHGGLLPGAITEFTGPAGVGKTQFCMHLSLLSVLSKEFGGKNTAVIYIDTETAFKPERIFEIIISRYPQLEDKITSVLSQIYVYQPSTIKSFCEILDTLETIAVEKEVGVLIVDSIASLARKELNKSANSNIIRSNLLASWAARLKYLAEQLHICVIATNQVTTKRIDEHPGVEGTLKEGLEDMMDEQENDPVVNTSQERVNTKFKIYATPALGNTWTHCVNTRLILQYTKDKKRQLLIAKSPVAPFAVFTYNIEEGGIALKGESYYNYSGTDLGLQKVQIQHGILP